MVYKNRIERLFSICKDRNALDIYVMLQIFVYFNFHQGNIQLAWLSCILHFYFKRKKKLKPYNVNISLMVGDKYFYNLQ